MPEYAFFMPALLVCGLFARVGHVHLHAPSGMVALASTGAGAPKWTVRVMSAIAKVSVACMCACGVLSVSLTHPTC